MIPATGKVARAMLGYVKQVHGATLNLNHGQSRCQISED